MYQAPQGYLEQQVFTAPPERLQLMLIEGAIRHLYNAKKHWNEPDFVTAWEFVVKARTIVAEILGAIKPDIIPEITDKVTAVYAFLFQTLCEAVNERDITKIDGAVKVLKAEQDTWKALCEKMLHERQKGTTDAVSLETPDAPAAAGPTNDAPDEPRPEGGFSFDA